MSRTRTSWSTCAKQSSMRSRASQLASPPPDLPPDLADLLARFVEGRPPARPGALLDALWQIAGVEHLGAIRGRYGLTVVEPEKARNRGPSRGYLGADSRRSTRRPGAGGAGPRRPDRPVA